MILVDANLLLYAHSRTSEQHERAKTWLEDALGSSKTILLPWLVILAFLRISTNSRVWPNPFTVAEASAAVDALLASNYVEIPAPGNRHWRILNGLLSSTQCRGPLITDAHLAALAIEYGATLCTNDRDFSRFPGLKVHYPLA